jgi:hypothetical protein
LPVSLDYPILIAPLVFSNVYLVLALLLMNHILKKTFCIQKPHR